jgi:hypothetical protein
LDRKLLEGLPERAKDSAPAAKSSAAKPLEGLQPPKGAEAEVRLRGDSEHPLVRIANAMRAVENRISQSDTSRSTQEAQTQIVKDLSALLEKAQPQTSASSEQSASQSGTNRVSRGTGDPAAGPPRDSTTKVERGTKVATEAADVKEVMRRIWGHLPEKLRDQMQASLSEEFLPKYQQLIEDYYRRLAEESRER